MTPLIDVVFQLLLFFLVATRFAAEDRELDVMLPAASEAKPLTAQPQRIVRQHRSSRSVLHSRQDRQRRRGGAHPAPSGRRQSGQSVRDHPRRQTSATGPRSIRDERLQPGRHFRLHAHHGGRGELAAKRLLGRIASGTRFPSGTLDARGSPGGTSGRSYTRPPSTYPCSPRDGKAVAGTGWAGNGRVRVATNVNIPRASRGHWSPYFGSAEGRFRDGHNGKNPAHYPQTEAAAVPAHR